MPIIDTPAGTLEVQNAILSASEFRATQKIGVANSAPTKTFSVGDKLHVSTTDLDAVSISGNLVAQKVKVGNLLVSPTFDLASVSNVGNTTSNIIQFANATTGFVTTANVEIGGNISFTSNAQVSVDSNVVAEYTGPHPRQPTEKLLKKYPDIDFATGEFEFNTLSNTFTQGGYTVTSSGNYGGNQPLSIYTAWRSFTGLTDGYGTGWTSSGGSDVSGGAAAYTNGIANSNNSLSGIDTSTSTGGVSSRNGAWIKLELPNKIKLSHIELYDRYGFDEGGIPGGTGRTNENVVEAFIYGSNNNSTWYELGKQSDHFYPSNYTDKVPALVTINSNTAYKYFIIQPTKLNKQLAYASYGQIMFYGREEGASIAGDTSIDTTLKSVFNIPLTDDYKMYIDGKYFIPGTHTSNNLVSGSSTSVIHHNATYDSTNKFWTLDGSTESNVTTDHLGLEGDTPHTVSMWFNNSNLETNVTTQQLFSLGNDKTVYVDDNSIAANTWHNFTYAYQGDGGSMITYLDGRKISDETVEDTYKQYPPFPMMDYHIGGYKVTASSEYEPTNAYRAWEAFNDTGMASNLDYYGWTGGRDTYNTNGGDGKRTTLTWSGSTQHVGEHIKLELPHKIVLNEVQFQARQAAAIERQLPRQFTIVGSNDDVNWETIHQEMRTSNPSHNEFHVMTGASKHKGFKYIALVVKCSGTANTNDHISIGNLKYFGHKEGDVIRFPEPNTTLKYPHVTMTNRAQRGYVVKASSFYSATGNPAYHVFDNNPTGAKWATEAAANYGNGGNTYSGSKNLGTNNGGSGTVGGEWLFLELPNKVKLQQARIVVHENTNERPQQFVIYGSNDLTGAWTAVDTTYQSSDFNVTVGTVGKSWTVSTASGSNYYKYLGIVVTKVSGNSQLFAITQLDLFGVEENNTVPAVVGGPFHGKVANFRVYDTFLNEDRIKEIYDVDKDGFGHTKSTMTFHKGRIGVGTTEPQGSLAIVDECNTVEKFPSVNPSSSECFIEGQGTFNISSTPTYFYTVGPKNVSDNEHEEVNKDDSYKIFSKNDFRSIRMKDAGNNQRDKFTYDCAATKPHRNEQLAPTTDFGSWFKLESPRRVSLKTADIQCIPFWRQIGDDLYGFGDGTNSNPGHLSVYGETCDISNDGSRIVIGAPHHPGDGAYQGAVEVREWSGQQWLRVGQLIDSTLDTDYLGVDVGISGNGERIIIGSPYAENGAQNNAGRVDVYDIIGNTWTLASPAFYGGGANNQAGMGVTISHDGQIIAYSEIEYDGLPGSNCGRIRVYTWNRNARTWSQRGSDILGDAPSDKIGLRMDMSDDGNYIIAGTNSASSSDGKVWVYYWNSSTSDYAQKGSTISGPSGSGDSFGSDVAISEDGNTILIGQQLEDAPSDTNAGAAYIYTWTNNSWTLKQKLIPQALTGADDQFGSSLDMSGDAKRIIIGAGNYPSTGNSAAGRVVVYEYSENADLWLRRNPDVRDRGGLGGFGSIGYDGTDGNGSMFGASPNGLRISNDGSAIIVSGRTTDADGLMLQVSDNQRDLTVDGKLGVAMTTQTNLGMVRVFNQPATIKGVWGSNDDKNWTKLTNTPKKFILNDQVVYKNLDNPNYFKYHAVIADHYTTLEHINLEGVFEKGTSILNDGIMSVSRKITAPEIESTGGIKLIGGNNPISYESDIVIEQPRARRIFKYPRSKLNSANDSGYQVQASVGSNTYRPWYAFGGDIETSSGNRLGNSGSVGWHTGVSGYSQYNGTDGFYSGSTRLGSSSETVLGEYLVLDLPERIALQYYKIWPQGYAGSVGDTYANEPRAWRIYGRNRISNDASFDYHKSSGNDHPNTGDERWTEISLVRDMTLASGGFQENGAKFYVYPRYRDTLFNQFAIVIEQRAPGAGAEVGVSVRQLEYYGYPEYDTENTGRDLQISSVPNTSFKDHCNLLWDARNYTGNGRIYDESYRYDEVGESRPTTDGTVNCGFHDGDIKSFVFDGVYTSNVTATTTNLRAGDVMFTAALWVKKISDKNGNGYIMKIGNGGNNYQSVLVFVNNDRFIFDTWGSQLVPGPSCHIQNNRWYHIVIGHYEGNTPDLIRSFFYLDGQKLEGINEVTTAGGTAQFNLQGNDIILGASDLTATENFHGHIANIRIFNKALDHEEITQLYSSQKKYFGHGSDLILTGGKLGIGQMNPIATLDVHGDINLTGTILGRKEWVVTTWANSNHMGNAIYTNGEVLFKTGTGAGTQGGYTGDSQHYFDYVQCKNGADPSAWDEGSGCFYFPESGLYNVYLNLFYNTASGGRHLIMYMTYPNSLTKYRHYLRSNAQAADEIRTFSEMFYVEAGSKIYFTSGGGTTVLYLGGGLDGESYTGNGFGHTFLRVNKII